MGKSGKRYFGVGRPFSPDFGGSCLDYYQVLSCKCLQGLWDNLVDWSLAVGVDSLKRPFWLWEGGGARDIAYNRYILVGLQKRAIQLVLTLKGYKGIGTVSTIQRARGRHSACLPIS